MLLFIRGEVVILTVEQNIQLLYQEYVAEFGDISFTQWTGSKEYEIAYATAQRMYKNAIKMQEAIDGISNFVVETNEVIKRPAVLHSRVSERFLEELDPDGNPYVATIRQATEATRGIIAICVDYERTVDELGNPDAKTRAEDEKIALLIADEMLAAGQFLIGSVGVAITLSNGQEIYSYHGVPQKKNIEWKTTITIDRNSQHAQDTVDEITAKFLANFNSMNSLGGDITPDSYFQVDRDAPYASKITSSYSIDGGTFTENIGLSNFDDKYIATMPAGNVTFIEVS